MRESRRRKGCVRGTQRVCTVTRPGMYVRTYIRRHVHTRFGDARDRLREIPRATRPTSTPLNLITNYRNYWRARRTD